MISKEMAHKFADEWIDAWNSHNLDQILSHYSDDFEMTTPFISLLMNEPTGTLKGKQNVGEYWAKAFARYPDLKFQLLEVMFSINSIVIYYRPVNDRLAAEVLFFDDDGKVKKSIAHYNDI